MRFKKRSHAFAAGAVAIVVAAAVLAGCGSGGATGTSSTKYSASNPRHGGSLTVLEWTGFAGSWPGLDPSTDTNGAADESYMDAIFGELFELGPGNKTIDDLATGYKYTNGGKTTLIFLRKGVKFSDGTPFNADALAYNWRTDDASSCSCKPVWNQKTAPVIKVVNAYEVSFTLTYVDAAFINGLQDDIFNWIYSPTAAKKTSAQNFSLKPVGAGPFTVVSDSPSSALVLKRNPNYWQKGLPYLNKLTFKAVANDEAAYEAMLAGSGQAYEDLSTPQLVSGFKKHFAVTTEPSTSPYDIQLNTSIAPFNNINARKAIYAATDTALLDQKLFGDSTPPGESFEAPAGLFYEKTVPGYIGYNLAEAKKLVSEVPGGINITLFTITNTDAEEMDEALQTMWQAAGMKVTLASYDLSSLIAAFEGGKWTAGLQTAGAWDPATGVGVAFRFASTSPFSGVHDAHLDAILNAAAGTVNATIRAKDYDAAAAYIAKEAYGPFLFPINGYDVAAHGVGGPGLTVPIAAVAVAPEILWQSVYNNNSK